MMLGMDFLEEQQDAFVAVKSRENCCTRCLSNIAFFLDCFVPLAGAVNHMHVGFLLR